LDSTEDGIQYDFNKLLQADSQYKILVFQSKTVDGVKHVVKRMKNAVEKYQSKSSSEYLFCEWSTSENRFYFETHTKNT